MSVNPYQTPAADRPVSPRARLLPVAISLLVACLLWIFLSLFGIALFAGTLMDAPTPKETRSIYVTYILYLGVNIAYSLLLCSGAFSMLRNGSYVWAVVTSCLAAVPFLGPCYVLGMPLGLWALFVLRDKEVRASFRRDSFTD